MTIAGDVQKLEPGTLIEMFELDATRLGGTVVRFHAGVNSLGSDVVWQGNVYVRFPIQASGFQKTGKGTAPRPKLQVANISGMISALVRQYNDLVGATLTRRRTFYKYLDAANYPGAVNPLADPTAHFPDEVWQVNRKSAQNGVFVEFELAAASDVAGVMLPRRQVIQNVCPWLYRSAECGYAGGPVADINDQPTADPTLDRCGRRMASCKLRWGEFAELPIGSFPGAGLIK